MNDFTAGCRLDPELGNLHSLERHVGRHSDKRTTCDRLPTTLVLTQGYMHCYLAWDGHVERLYEDRKEGKEMSDTRLNYPGVMT